MIEYSMTAIEIGELRKECALRDNPARFEDYFELRDVGFAHADAIFALSLAIPHYDCQRLKKAGGSMQELVDLAQALRDAGIEYDEEEEVFNEYIHQRCARSKPYADVLRVIYSRYGLTAPLTSANP